MAAKGGGIVSFYSKGAYGPFGYQVVYGIAAVLHIGEKLCLNFLEISDCLSHQCVALSDILCQEFGRRTVLRYLPNY